MKAITLIHAASVGALAALGMASEMEQSFPDGASVRIESVQIGGDFSYGAEAPVTNPVHADGTACGWRAFDHFSHKPAPGDRSLYVWFRISRLYEFWDALLIDDDGQIDRKYCFDALTGSISSSAGIVGFRFPSYPRSQKTMRIRLIRGGEWHKQNRTPAGLEFVIPNPAPIARTTSPGPSLLQHTIDGTEIKLESLDTGITGPDPNGDSRTVSRIRFTSSDAGQPSRTWALSMLELVDSFGNSLESYHASGPATFKDNGCLQLWIYSPLWLAGNPWTLSADFIRVDDLPASQRTTVKALPVDPDERMVDRKRNRTFQFRSEEFPEATVSASYYTACDQPGNILRLALELDHVPAGFHCGVLEVKDDTGKPTKRVFGHNDFRRDPQEKENPRYLIDIPDTSKTVDITFTIQKIRRLTFRADATPSSDPLP